MSKTREKTTTAKVGKIPIVTGKEFLRGWPKPKRRVTLAEVQERLSKIKGRMDKEVAKMREEE